MTTTARKPPKKPTKEAMPLALKRALADKEAAMAALIESQAHAGHCKQLLQDCQEKQGALQEAYHGEINHSHNLIDSLSEARTLARQFRRAAQMAGVPVGLGGECEWLTEEP